MRIHKITADLLNGFHLSKTKTTVVSMASTLRTLEDAHYLTFRCSNMFVKILTHWAPFTQLGNMFILDITVFEKFMQLIPNRVLEIFYLHHSIEGAFIFINIYQFSSNRFFSFIRKIRRTICLHF